MTPSQALAGCLYQLRGKLWIMLIIIPLIQMML
jgi:hypothetical protein